ncbi:erythroferrone-like isoform X2 [Passer montanus]|uniref:erythroferrone-like isoform X2 n=1 Tax=Passer montanus TaxID=9160 RepID=UPI001960C949|nr:erythroferrone-like isoform X2 [Passer montanus]
MGEHKMRLPCRLGPPPAPLAGSAVPLRLLVFPKRSKHAALGARGHLPLQAPRSAPLGHGSFPGGEEPEGRARQRGGAGAGSGGGMRLPELCLALLCAASTGTGTEAPRAARERPLAPGRGEPGAARLDPRQVWMLLAGSPGRGSAERGRSAPAGPGSPGRTSAAVPEELLRELQLLLAGTAKMCRTAGEGRTEESSKGSPQAGAQRRVEAAFHCQTREDIAVEQSTRQELGLFHIPERERLFQRGPGLNLTSGQYTAPLAGYYTFSSTLHIARREPRRRRQGCRGSRLRVLICVQSCCQHNSQLESVSWLESSGDLFTISVTGTLYLQVSGASSTATVLGRKVPSMAPAQGWAAALPQVTCKPQSSQGRALLGHCGTDKGLVLLFPRRKGRGSSSSSWLLCAGESSLLGPARPCLEPRGGGLALLIPLSPQAGQYASVFVDNTAGSPITVQSGSDFSAVLLGV